MSVTQGAADQFALRRDAEILEVITRRRTSPWNSMSRNYISDLDPNWLLLNIPERVNTRVDTQCVFCRRRIWKGQYRYRYSTGFSRASNYKRRWFQLHEHCYFAMVKLSIERLKQQLPSGRV